MTDLQTLVTLFNGTKGTIAALMASPCSCVNYDATIRTYVNNMTDILTFEVINDTMTNKLSSTCSRCDAISAAQLVFNTQKDLVNTSLQTTYDTDVDFRN